MRKVSMATRDELLEAVGKRYRQGGREEKARILDEFAAVTGYHRKHAMRLLRCPGLSRRDRPRPQRRIYDEAVQSALVVLWEASDRICGKRLKPLVSLLVEAMERHGHLRLEEAVRDRLLTMSAATIDRMLHDTRIAIGRPRRRTAASALRRSIPIRTFKDWNDPPPGFFEADLVAHCGPRTAGSYVQTLVLTDIASGWTECAPMVVREQQLLTTVLSEVRSLLPFPLLGFDTDNDSVFMNETVRDYCAAEGIAFTRCRPYRKNDQAWVEQKNGAIVRKMVGYRRLTGVTAATVLAQLYAVSRLFVNFFQPSFKLAGKRRDGAWVVKRYHKPATPCQRLLADPRTPDTVRQRLEQSYRQLDPIHLLHEIRATQQRLVELADALPTAEDKPALDDFLAGLRTAWQGGEVRPTALAKPKAKRERRRPDPLLAVTGELRQWFAVEPWRSGHELLQKLQAAHPGLYPDGLLRTVQRRVKIWRAERAHEMVFGALSDASPQVVPQRVEAE
jgi:hypothetical protein